MTRRLQGSALLRLFSTSIATQALLSAGNFVVGLLLLRNAEAAQYGYFVLAQTSILLLVAVQGSLVSGPMNILAPKRSEQDRALLIGTIARTQRGLLGRLFPALLLVPALVWLSDPRHPQLALLLGGAILAGWMALRREFLRSVLLVYFRPDLLFRADALYVLVLLGSTALAVALPGPVGAYAVLGLSLSAALSAALAYRAVGRRQGWTAGGDGPAVWREMRPLGTWALIGAMTSWAYLQGYNYVLAGTVGAVAVAHVNAARLMLMPMVLLQVGVEKMLVPQAASWLHRDGLRPMVRRAATFALGVALLDAIYLALLWPLRDWITADLMRVQIGDRDLLILLWGATMILSSMRGGLMCSLVAMARFRALAAVAAASAAVSLTATFFGVQHLGLPGAVSGMIAGELAGLMGMLGLIVQGLRAERRARAVT